MVFEKEKRVGWRACTRDKPGKPEKLVSIANAVPKHQKKKKKKKPVDVVQATQSCGFPLHFLTGHEYPVEEPAGSAVINARKRNNTLGCWCRDSHVLVQGPKVSLFWSICNGMFVDKCQNACLFTMIGFARLPFDRFLQPSSRCVSELTINNQGSSSTRSFKTSGLRMNNGSQ